MSGNGSGKLRCGKVDTHPGRILKIEFATRASTAALAIYFALLCGSGCDGGTRRTSRETVGSIASVTSTQRGGWQRSERPYSCFYDFARAGAGGDFSTMENDMRHWYKNWRFHQLFIMTALGGASLIGCTGDVEYCVGPAETKQYKIIELNFNGSGDDLTGDGVPDMLFDTILSRFWNTGGGLSPLPVKNFINDALKFDKGIPLIDVHAHSTQQGCATVTLSTAESRVNDDRRGDLQGRSALTLDGFGTQRKLTTIPFLKMADPNKYRSEFTLPFTSSSLAPMDQFFSRFILYGTRIQFENKAQDVLTGEIIGTLTGVLRVPEVTEEVSLRLAHVITLLMQRGYESEQQIGIINRQFEKEYGIPGSVTDNKCKVEKNCCHLSPRTCVILPEEVRIAGNNPVSVKDAGPLVADVPSLDGQGVSFGISFRARPTDSIQVCPSGTFCAQALPEGLRTAIAGSGLHTATVTGWAAAGNDLFLAANTYLDEKPHSEIWRYDGFKWTSYLIDPDPDPWEGANVLWGDSRDSIWVGRRDAKWPHWNGAYWQSESIHPDPSLARPYFVRSMHGDSPKSIFAGATYGNDRSTLLHFDGKSWSELTSRDHQQAFMAVHALSNNHVIAAGSNRLFSSFRLNPDALTKNVNNRTVPGVSLTEVIGFWRRSATELWVLFNQDNCPRYVRYFIDQDRWEDGPAQSLPKELGLLQSVWQEPSGALWALGAKALLRSEPAASGKVVFRPITLPKTIELSTPQGQRWQIFGARNELAVWVMDPSYNLLRYEP